MFNVSSKCESNPTVLPITSVFSQLDYLLSLGFLFTMDKLLVLNTCNMQQFTIVTHRLQAIIVIYLLLVVTSDSCSFAFSILSCFLFLFLGTGSSEVGIQHELIFDSKTRWQAGTKGIDLVLSQLSQVLDG